MADGLDTDFTEGYGLFNVNKRLLLYYGKEAKITITSIVDKGTTVHVTVPTMQKEPQNMYKVFIAEDEHLILESLKRNLSQLYEKLPIEIVGEAGDGEVALSMILELHQISY